MRAVCTLACDITASKTARILQGCLGTHADAKWRYGATANAVATCVSDSARARTWDLRSVRVHASIAVLFGVLAEDRSSIALPIRSNFLITTEMHVV